MRSHRQGNAARHLFPVAFAAVALLSAATAFFGPPGITVREISGEPPTPGAVLEIVARHHTDEQDAMVSGKAYQMVNGKRTEKALTVAKGTRPGHYGVPKQWSAGSPWVLVFTVSQGDHGEHGTAEALVAVDATGKISKIESLMETNARGDRYPRKATDAEVASALRSGGR